MKNKILSLLETNEVVVQQHTLVQSDYYDSTVISKNKIVQILSDNDVIINEDSAVRYSISRPKDKVNMYGRYGNFVKKVQKIVYTIDVIN